MFSQVYARPEPPAGAMNGVWDSATDPLMIAILVDPIPMGDLAYNYLTHEMQGDLVPHPFNWLGHQWLPCNTSWNMDSPPPGTVPERSTPEFMMPSPSSLLSHFPLTPSPPPSQTPTPECQQPASPPHEPSCHAANPFYEIILGKWCCDACGSGFRGHWECKRHITNAGKRAVCLACNKKISRRGDSLQRHYSKHCKRPDLGRDSGNVSLENAFVYA